jgi:hypothetical protein
MTGMPNHSAGPSAVHAYISCTICILNTPISDIPIFALYYWIIVHTDRYLPTKGNVCNFEKVYFSGRKSKEKSNI